MREPMEPSHGSCITNRLWRGGRMIAVPAPFQQERGMVGYWHGFSFPTPSRAQQMELRSSDDHASANRASLSDMRYGIPIPGCGFYQLVWRQANRLS